MAAKNSGNNTHFASGGKVQVKPAGSGTFEEILGVVPESLTFSDPGPREYTDEQYGVLGSTYVLGEQEGEITLVCKVTTGTFAGTDDLMAAMRPANTAAGLRSEIDLELTRFAYFGATTGVKAVFGKCRVTNVSLANSRDGSDQVTFTIRCKSMPAFATDWTAVT
jgi:hypothetical protein